MSFLNKIINRILFLFENNDHITNDLNSLIKVFTTLIHQLKNHVFIQKQFVCLIKTFLKKTFLNYDSLNTQQIMNYPYDYIIEDFDQIATILLNNGENNFNVDLITFLNKQIFDQPINNNTCKNTSSLNSSTVSNISYLRRNSSVGNIDYKQIFMENLHKVKF
jgi:hypothetical protein